MLDATLSVVTTKVAIPQLGDQVAPRFEVAAKFLIGNVENNEIRSTRTVVCEGPEGYRRIRMLQIHRVKVLICNGIKASHLDLLRASGITVITKVGATVDHALLQFARGRLVPEQGGTDGTPEACEAPHEHLVRRAKAVFEICGYTVSPGPGQDACLIDLVAEISCPVCQRPVRVAICCGAHTYRTSQEITEFHRATSSGYNARVYVCPSKPSILKCCQEYGIELIDPDQSLSLAEAQGKDSIPVLTGVVVGHEAVSKGHREG